MVRKAGSAGDGKFRPAFDDGKPRVAGDVVRVWSGEVKCDVCEVDKTGAACMLERDGVMVDGATVWGPWACMCSRAFREVGRGIGPGVGQRYMRQRLDSGAWAWVKVAS